MIGVVDIKVEDKQTGKYLQDQIRIQFDTAYQYTTVGFIKAACFATEEALPYSVPSMICALTEIGLSILENINGSPYAEWEEYLQVNRIDIFHY